MATLSPQHQSRLVIGGHYDVCGNIQGADDNASAVAGVIESAKRLYVIKETIPFRIDFVCFTLEEPPYFGTENMGSYQYAKSLHVNNVNLIGMINYEMIGYYTDENIDISLFEPFIVKKDADILKGDFIAIVSDEQSQSFMSSFDFMNVTKKIQHLEAVLPSPMSFVTASDHLNFWRFGYKAIMVIDTAHFRNPKYDTLETLDVQKMEYVIELVVEGIKNIYCHS